MGTKKKGRAKGSAKMNKKDAPAKAAGKKGPAQLTVRVQPSDGAPTDRKVTLPKEGLTAGDICAQLGIAIDKKNIYLGGTLVAKDRLITAKDVLEVKDKPPAEQLRVQERGIGS